MSLNNLMAPATPSDIDRNMLGRLNGRS
jgi:hypothetical protein